MDDHTARMLSYDIGELVGEIKKLREAIEDLTSQIQDLPDEIEYRKKIEVKQQDAK